MSASSKGLVPKPAPWPSAPTTEQGLSPDELLDEAVTRFLSMKLPLDFSPDAGITFTPSGSYESHLWPTGTNLMTANQAREMFKECLALFDDSTD